MKKLLLIRHGEAQPARRNQEDLERPLSDKGKTDISALSTRLSIVTERDFKIICSTAVRAKQTAELLHKENTFLLTRLYYGEEESYIEAITENSETETLILVGHNPVISLVGGRLSGGQAGIFHPGSCIELQYKEDTVNPLSDKPERVIIHHPPYT